VLITSAQADRIRPQKGRGKGEASGFTLVALVATLAIIALLSGVYLPLLATNREKARITICNRNLRQFALASMMYAQSNNDRFPSMPKSAWPWDLSVTAVDELIKHGASKESFYCPGGNNSRFWNFTASFRVIGYSTTFPGGNIVRATNINDRIASAKIIRIGDRDITIPASARELLADGTISIGSNERDRTRNRYVRIEPGFRPGFNSPHLTSAGKLPSGGNIAFLDGHNEWRRFERMVVRTDGVESFWW
jgi:prepilin-type processing-associated H-X9-DG protein